MPQTFWRVQKPEYDSDYQDTYVNGEFARTHSMPGIGCTACGQTWASSEVMPFPCPTALQTHPLLLDSRPVAAGVHRSLRREVLSALHAEERALAIAEDAIRGPFLGGELRVPSRPGADFLWAGIGSLIVSSPVQAMLLDAAPEAIAWAPARLRRTGHAEVALPPTTDVPGAAFENCEIEEPEDLVEQLAVHEPSPDIGPYFELAVSRGSERPPGAEVTSRCTECGREEFVRTNRRLVLQPAMWRGAPIFLLATTLWIVVTDELRDALEKMQVTNVRFVPIPAAAP